MLGSETKSAFNVPRIGEGQSVDIGNFESHVRYPTRSAHRLRLLPLLNQVFCRASVCARLTDYPQSARVLTRFPDRPLCFSQLHKSTNSSLIRIIR
jgi:hypothetical protein